MEMTKLESVHHTHPFLVLGVTWDLLPYASHGDAMGESWKTV